MPLVVRIGQKVGKKWVCLHINKWCFGGCARANFGHFFLLRRGRHQQRRIGHATILCPLLGTTLTSGIQIYVRQNVQGDPHSRSSHPSILHLEPAVTLPQCLPNLSLQKRPQLNGLQSQLKILARCLKGSCRVRLAGKGSNHSSLARSAGLESKFNLMYTTPRKAVA